MTILFQSGKISDFVNELILVYTPATFIEAQYFFLTIDHQSFSKIFVSPSVCVPEIARESPSFRCASERKSSPNDQDSWLVIAGD